MIFKDKRYISFPRENNEDVLFKTFNLGDLGFNDYDYIVVNATINNENKLSITLNENSKKAIKLMDIPEENVKLLLKSIRTHLNEHNMIIFEEIQRQQPVNLMYGGGVAERLRRNILEDYNIDNIDLNQYQNILINNIVSIEEGFEFRNIFIDNLNRLDDENEVQSKIKKSIVWMLHEQVNIGTVRNFNEERTFYSVKGDRIVNLNTVEMIENLGIDPNFGIYSDILVEVYGTVELPFNNQINHVILFEDNSIW